MRTLTVILMLVLAVGASAQYAPRSGRLQTDMELEFDYRILTGDTTYYDSADRDGVLTGASDSLYTRWYDFVGDIGVQIEAYGGTTANYYVALQTANLGSAVRDSLHFSDSMWIAWTGAGLANYTISTSASMCDQTGRSPVIVVPALSADKYRFMVRSAATQSGNTTIKLKVNSVKEY